MPGKLLFGHDAASDTGVSNGYHQLMKYQSTYSGVVNKIFIYGRIAGDAFLSLYASDGDGERLWYNDTTYSLSVGWNEIEVSPSVEVSSGGYYELGVLGVLSGTVGYDSSAPYNDRSFAAVASPPYFTHPEDLSSYNRSTTEKKFGLYAWGWEPPVITSIDGDDSILDNQTGVSVVGTDFMDAGDTLQIYLCSTSDYATAPIKVAQTVTVHDDTSAVFDVVPGTLSPGTVYAFAVTALNQVSATHAITLTDSVIEYESDVLTGRLVEVPVQPGTISFIVDDGTYRKVVTDDGNGNLEGEGYGTIRYDIGKYSFRFQGNSIFPLPAVGTNVTADYVPVEGKDGWVLTHKIKLDIVPGSISGQSELAVNDAWIRLLDKIRDSVLPCHVEIISEQYSEQYLSQIGNRFDISDGDIIPLDSEGVRTLVDE